jgi:hypothetical protein
MSPKETTEVHLICVQTEVDVEMRDDTVDNQREELEHSANPSVQNVPPISEEKEMLDNTIAQESLDEVSANSVDEVPKKDVEMSESNDLVTSNLQEAIQNSLIDHEVTSESTEVVGPF